MLANDDITRVFGFYELGRPVEVLQAVQGYVNETAFVRTTCGRYVLRRNHRRFSEPALRYRHAATGWLCEHDVPVPALMTTRDGATLLQLDRRFYEVHAFVAGDSYDPTRPQQIAGIGATLALYHTAIRDFPPPPLEPVARYTPWAVAGLVEQLIERDIMGELNDMLTWYCARAAQLRATLPDTLHAGLPHLAIHGDIHSDNLRFCGDQVAALLDFDQMSWDVRLADLADALVAFASEPFPEPGWGVFTGPLDEARATRLVEAYGSTALLTPREIAALPAMVELLWLQGELGRVRSTVEGAPDYHRSVLNQGRRLSMWMASHGPGLVGVLSGLCHGNS